MTPSKLLLALTQVHFSSQNINFSVIDLSLFSRAGAGSHYGTFSGAIGAFSPNIRPKKAFAPTGRNFLVNPSKNGTGYGYVNVLIGKPTTHSSEPYDKAKELFRVRLKFNILLQGTTTCPNKK